MFYTRGEIEWTKGSDMYVFKDNKFGAQTRQQTNLQKSCNLPTCKNKLLFTEHF